MERFGVLFCPCRASPEESGYSASHSEARCVRQPLHVPTFVE